MSDLRDQTAIPSASDIGGPDSPGGWLKRERERQGTTVQRIAADMHLSVAAIEAMEANRFATLGAPVFARGHLRKYSSLLGLPVERVAELYDKLEDAPRQVDPVPVTQRAPEPALRPAIREMLNLSPDSKQRPQQLWPWIAATLIFGGVIAGSTWWFLGRPSKTTVTEATAESMGGADVTKVTPPPEVAAPANSPSPANVPSAPQTMATVTPAPRAARPAGAPPPGKVRVRLTFARESWVEVYDVGGNRMLYDVGRVDLPRMIDVEPPALVVLGDAGAVTTEANDKVVVIPQKNISGTVARFTIAADGSVK